MGRLVLVLSLAGLLAVPGQARAAVSLSPCGSGKQGVLCGTVPVPLDRSGLVPGTITLHVEELPASGIARGTMFMVAGGPGQGSARAFALGANFETQLFQFLFPGYNLVAFDNRGTGTSGLLECPALARATGISADQEAQLAQQCAATIGSRREFYATRDHAADTEAVRQALGLGKIGVFGVSYGTKLALAYALAYPSSVERLLLDSVLPVNQPDPFERDVLQSMPTTLAEYCPGNACRTATPNFSGDVVALANALEAKPISGRVLRAPGTQKTLHMNGEDLISTIINADLSPGLAAELPAAVHAARSGFTLPLLRLFDLTNRTSFIPEADLSTALYSATTCADGEFPWSPDTPVEARTGLLASAVAALPPGSFGPFGSWGAQLGSATFCKLWPSPAGHTPVGNGPLPDVPVLAISGGLDLRTPTSNAASVVRLFPHGHLLVVPGVGHSVLSADIFSGCAARAVRSWIQVGGVPSACPRVPFWERPLAAFPRTSSGRVPAATLALAAKALREAQATWLQVLFSSSSFAPAGLYGGKETVHGLTFTLSGYSIVPGMQVSGKIAVNARVAPFGLKGTVNVSGPAAAAGALHVSGRGLSGTLGGRRVSARL